MQPLPSTSSKTRRRFLQFAGFASLGLIPDILYRAVIAHQSSVPNSSKSTSPANNLSKFSFEVVTVNAKGEISDRRNQEAQFFPENINGVTLEILSIPDGTFIMGAPDTEKERGSNEAPQHQVNVASFFMGKYPVTQAQWEAVAALPQINIPLNPHPSSFKGANRPVEQVSWNEAQEFCDRLSRKTGKTYRLPSEAEWEYACRARTNTPFYFGENITTDLVNYNGNFTYAAAPKKGIYRQQTTDVGSFPPNAFGLYDMHGNVWEWCADPLHESYHSAPSDGSVWQGGDNTHRLLRGGSWGSFPWGCRSANRNWDAPGSGYRDYGFRVCLNPTN